MASNAFAGVGTLFQRKETDSSGDSYATIAEVNSISGPNKTRDTIDVTSLDSTGGYREYIPGFRDAGECTLEMNFTRDGYVLLNEDFESSDLRYYQFVLPDTGNTTISFAGYITAVGSSVPTDDKVTCSVTIKISGQVTIES